MPEATNVLRQEHASMGAMLVVLEEMVAGYHAHQAPPARDMLDTVHFFLCFGDRLHHTKEERVLFPALVRADADYLMLLDHLLEDHQHLRALLARLESAFQAVDRADYFTTAREYSHLLRVHLLRENTELLPAAERSLTADEQHRLNELFLAVQDEQLPAGEVTHWLVRQEELAQRYAPR